MIPRGAVPFYNRCGTAPGFGMKTGKALFCVMPGVPVEMETMLNKSVIPFLKKKFTFPIPEIVKIFKLFGIGESEAAGKLDGHIRRGSDPRIDITVANSIITLKVITLKTDGWRKRINSLSRIIKKELTPYIFSDSESSLAELLILKMADRKLKLSVAESCTGGLLASTLMSVSGASSIFDEGAVTYSNEAKIRSINVNRKTILKHGAVSKETALEMAEGILKKTGTDLSCSTTGIAGPSGGSKEKPVGTVWFGFAKKGNSITCKKHLWGDRNGVRIRAVNFAMKRLIDFIDD